MIVVLISCESSSKKNTIHIACSSNMQIAMDSITALFSTKYGINCETTYGSSGLLTSQIQNGAPYDVFFSANMNYPNTIYKNSQGQEPKIYGQGQLILVYHKSLANNTVRELLNDKSIKKIGLADDELAPYGVAAIDYLKNTKQLSSLKSKLVFGESIDQVNLYLATRSVEVAFTNYSFIIKNKAAFDYLEIDPQHYAPINQGAMILNHGLKESPLESEKFINFFFSKKCKHVLKYFGYLTN